MARHIIVCRQKIILSGAGVQFESHIALKKGDYTELKIIVPIFPYPKITILCQVVRSESTAGRSLRVPSGLPCNFLLLTRRIETF